MTLLFQIGISGIQAARTKMRVHGHNLANVATEGFSRQQTAFTSGGAAIIGNQVLGVTSSDPQRVEDRALTRSLHNRGEQYANSSAQSRLLAQASSILGEADDNPLSTSLSQFFTSMGEAALDPSNIPARQAVIDSATQLTSVLRTASSRFEEVRNGADTLVANEANEVNQLLASVADLNIRIFATEGGGTAYASDLRDERDRVIGDISKRMAIQVVQGDFSSVAIQTADGRSLVNGREAFSLVATPNGDNAGHVDLQISNSTGTQTITASEVGGSIGGILTARDTVLGGQVTNLDSLAYDLGTEVNTLLAGGTDLDGTTPGAALFTIGDEEGAAGRITVNSAIATSPRALAFSESGAVGNNEIVLDIMALEDDGIIGANALTPGEAISATLYDFGLAARNAASRERSDEVLLQDTMALRDSVLGVSSDEELLALTEAQRAFQGAARLIAIADEVLQELINLKR